MMYSGSIALRHRVHCRDGDAESDFIVMPLCTKQHTISLPDT
jgi:hypothetical protein